MTTRATIITFIVVFVIGIFFVVIFPFFLVKRPAPSTTTLTNPTKQNAKQEVQLADQGVFRSDDGGVTWQQKAFVEGSDASIATLKVNRLIPDPKDPETYYLLTNGAGIWVTKSRGDLWAQVIDQAHVLDPKSDVLGFAVNPANPQEWYAVVFQANRGRLLVSEDGGAHFREAYSVSLDRYGIFDVVYGAGRVEIVTGQGGFLASQDHGRTWKVLRWFADGLVRMLVDPTDSDREYVISSRGSIFQTEDAGATWADVTNGIRSHTGATTNQNWTIDQGGTIYLASNFGLLRSRDHSVEYSQPPIIIPPDALPILASAIDPHDSRHIIASALNQLYESKDDGKSWAIIHLPSTKRLVGLLFDTADSNIMYAVVAP